MSSDPPPRWRLVRAGTDAVPVRVRRFFQARTRSQPPPASRTRSRRPWAVAAAVTVLLVLVAWLAWATPLLAVRQVQVTGTEILTPAQVRQAAAVPDRTPLLRVRRDEVADRVAALPPVAEVRVGRDLPSTLVIEVVERTPVAAVPSGESFLLIDDGGVVYHTVAQAPLDLPVLVLAEPGPDDPATRAALTVLAALTVELHAELQTLTVAGPASIELALFSGLTVLWGDETASAEKARVATALLDHEALPDPDGTVIDVSAPDVVAVR